MLVNTLALALTRILALALTRMLAPTAPQLMALQPTAAIPRAPMIREWPINWILALTLTELAPQETTWGLKTWVLPAA